MSAIIPSLLRLFVYLSLLTSSMLATSAIAAPGKKVAVIIPDIAVYPFTRYSQRLPDDSDNQTPTLVLDTDNTRSLNFITTLFQHWHLPYTESTANESAQKTIKTDWLFWHYDKDSKKTLSQPVNHFFSLNSRDRYRFELTLKPVDNNQTQLILSHSWREQEVDITPDSAMIWLKWKTVTPDKQAVSYFLQRMQTEFEKLSHTNQPVLTDKPAIHSASISAGKADTVNKPVIIAGVTTTITNTTFTNYQTINKPVSASWSALIQAVSDKNIAIQSVDNNQHIIRTKTLHANYDKTTHTLDLNHSAKQTYQFKIILMPGSRHNESSVFVYQVHSTGQSEKQNKTGSIEIASAFLAYLAIP